MKKKIFNFYWLLLLPLVLGAQYEPESLYLTNPDTAKALVKEVADFHHKAKDPAGGYFSFLLEDGTPMDQQPGGWPNYEYKSFCSISRLAYAFNRAFMLTGDTSYLYDARHALKFLYEKGYDTINEGWFFTYNMDADTSWGAPWAADNKWTFQQQYALVGLISMVEATGGKKNWYEEAGGLTDAEWFERGIDLLYNEVWDDHQDYFGYYENANNDWTGKTGKGFTGTIDGINTHAALAALMKPVPRYLDRFHELSDIARDRLVGSMDASGVMVGFPEIFDSQWNIITSDNNVSIGHMLKTAWCLGRAAIVFHDATYGAAAEKILDQVWEKDHADHDDLWDHVNGGPFDGGDWSTGKVTTRIKNHWVLEQGFTGPMINYFNTTDPDKRNNYLQMADQSLDFFEKHSVDKVHGCSWLDVSQDGSSITNMVKADNFKAGFHDAELGYYAYLYSNIYYYHDPVDLHYFFEARPEAWSVTLNPLAIGDDSLKITDVSLNGQEFTAFDTDLRMLNLAAGQGGVFRVRFNPNIQSTTIGENFLSADLVLRVYPNPFTEIINMELNLPERERVTVSLMDLSGRSVALLYAGHKEAGHHSFSWYPAGQLNLSGGIYLLNIQAGNQQIVRKLVYQMTK